MVSPGPGSGNPPGDVTPMTTSSCQMPTRMPIASSLGQSVRKMRSSRLRGDIGNRPGAEPRCDLVRESRHLEGVELERTLDLDVPDLGDPSRTRSHEHHTVAKADGLAHVVRHEDDRLAGLLPD